MRLRDFLAEERIVMPLPGESLDGAVAALLERLVSSGVVADAEKLRQRALEQRSEDTVVLGDRAFVLHYRSDAVSDLHVAMGTSPTGIRRTLDGEEAPVARIVLMVVAPPRLAARHLQLVRGFSRLLSREQSVEAILAVPRAAGVAAHELFASYELPEQLTVRDVMTERPRTTLPEVELHEAAREMIDGRLGAMPVVDHEGQLLGILSERELVRHLLTTQVLSDPRAFTQPGVRRKTVRDVMTRQVLCVAPEQPIAEVASLMSNKDVERVPVVREGRLVGFLTRGDIVRKLIGF